MDNFSNSSQEIKQLPCFNHIHEITEINSGLSNPCFKVSTQNDDYFIKQVSSNNEVNLGRLAGIHQLSPNVIYNNASWLVTDFIQGETLQDNNIPWQEKIATTANMLTKCHQLEIHKANISNLSVVNIIQTLCKQSHWDQIQQTKLMTLVEQLHTLSPHKKKLVCCHGDVNFSNILLDEHNTAWLVDFECAYLAPAAYDVAMCIAVNNLTEAETLLLIKHYQQLSAKNLDMDEINHYLVYGYVINSLWYLNAHDLADNQEEKANRYQLAQQQWQNLALLAQTTIDVSLKRLCIEFTNILTAFNFGNQS